MLHGYDFECYSTRNSLHLRSNTYFILNDGSVGSRFLALFSRSCCTSFSGSLIDSRYCLRIKERFVIHFRPAWRSRQETWWKRLLPILRQVVWYGHESSITQGPSSMNMLPRVAAIRQCQHEAVDRRLCSDISFIIAALRRASGLTKVDFALCANYLILNRLPTNPFPSFVGEKIARPIASAAVAHRFY